MVHRIWWHMLNYATKNGNSVRYKYYIKYWRKKTKKKIHARMTNYESLDYGAGGITEHKIKMKNK